MDLDPAQIVLQLGIAGALIYFGSKITLALLDRWSVAEAARTKVLADGFTALVGKVDEHTKADLAAQADVREDLAALGGKLDTALALRPAPRAQTHPRLVALPSTGPADDD